jgi:hypothetical protein
MNRFGVALVSTILALGLAHAPARAQSGTYDLHWLVLCGPDKYSQDQNTASVQRGQMQVVVTERTDPLGGPAFWEARNASTGAVVWPFANEAAGVQDMVLSLPPGCATSSYLGRFDWNAVANADAFQTFTISDAEPGIAGMSARAHLTGIRVAAPAPTAVPSLPPSPAAVTLSLASNQTISGSVPVRIAAAGLASAGTKRFFISVDGAQISARVESTAALTFWWNTTSRPNGTHTFSVRAVDAAGKTVTGSVNVIVRN